MCDTKACKNSFERMRYSDTELIRYSIKVRYSSLFFAFADHIHDKFVVTTIFKHENHIPRQFPSHISALFFADAFFPECKM